MQRHMASLAGELQKILQHVTDELATEVNREQQHLILMQDQARCDPSPAAEDLSVWGLSPVMQHAEKDLLCDLCQLI